MVGNVGGAARVTELLETLEIETAPGPRAAVIWMHGLGADGYDFEPIVPELDVPASLAVRFVFPHAPMRPVTINNGWVMRAWYDVMPVGGERREDEAGVRVSRDAIEALIAREESRGVPANRIVLAGFSQGGAMALHTGLRYADRLAGIMGLSCFLPLADRVGEEATAANRDVPIFLAHGTHDEVIPIARGRRSRDVLLGLGYRIEWREYPMPHGVSPAQIGDVAAWLRGVLIN
jgi:phospholipase/carboxylesterase